MLWAKWIFSVVAVRCWPVITARVDSQLKHHQILEKLPQFYLLVNFISWQLTSIYVLMIAVFFAAFYLKKLIWILLFFPRNHILDKHAPEEFNNLLPKKGPFKCPACGEQKRDRHAVRRHFGFGNHKKVFDFVDKDFFDPK